MLLSLNWLREFVPYEGTAQALGDRLTMLGLELEDIVRPHAGISDIVVGRVLTCAAHPESDHLSVCTVDVGKAGDGAPLDIVCGAPNVAAGQKVPVALVGTTMPDGLIIKKARLRGAPSHGMICSERELSLSDDHSGIMVLDAAAAVGERLVDALALDAEVLDISITPNRADALSVLGLARETALAFRLPLTLPAAALDGPDGSGGPEGDWTLRHPVSIADPSLCPLYQLRLIENVTIAPSPPAIRYRLRAAGVRPISNIVDVTNYIMLELGQPLHAFDRDLVEGGIIVAPAVEGETLRTLDGQQRLLAPGDLLIRDRLKPIALAGVMGGANSEMTAASRHVLLESAVFRPGTVRRTARRLGLSSEASYRFERGVDQPGNTYALNRAAAMMAALAGGVVRRGISRQEPTPWTAPNAVFRRKRVVALLGLPEADLSESFCADTLMRLGCALDRTDPECWRVQTPSWRHDLTREADLAEEAGRVYGLDRLPETLPPVIRPLERAGESESRHAFFFRVRHWGSGLGLNEAISYSFTSHADLDRLTLPEADRIAILNPLSEEQGVLRTALAPGLLHTVRTNLAHGAVGLRLFEAAATYHADSACETGVRETMRLGLALYGARHDTIWAWGEADADYPELRGLVEHLAAFLHLPDVTCNRVDSHPYLSPCVAFVTDGREIGRGGRLEPRAADTCHARKALWLAELDLDLLYDMQAGKRPRFAPLPVYPPVRRDITVGLPRGLSVDGVLEKIRNMNIAILEEAGLIDVFEPEDRQERNATYRLTFRHKGRTLKDTEADKERDAIAAALVAELKVTI
ncbi:MAG: phenylalanine--tRNA ligase subunit beta [Deltaproteobacteria bacterium]|jgi:phenylalanyl-tRNA synthetase beta chain|nr:phenylalanine--tRNA ligase subunit beta [Deltaproteobacteria bacterium]